MLTRERQLGNQLRLEQLEPRRLLTTVTLSPLQDNTLYESDVGELSNGLGEFLFAGRTGPRAGGVVRRALVAFDLSDEIPSDATINSVELSLNVSRVPRPDSATIDVHRLLADWGEGTSDAPGVEGRGTTATPGDATWLHREFPGTNWETAGGDFDTEASASQSIEGLGRHSWSSEGLVADVQQWIEDPDSNFGWILIGDESQMHTARRLDSLQNSTPGNRPRLTIDYSEPQTTPSVRIDPVDANEGDADTTPFTFAVTFSESPSAPTTIQFETFGQTAAADDDFQSASGMLTFTPDGPLVQNIEVLVNGDEQFEPDEQFGVRLSGPDTVEFETNEALGTIVNDDQQPMTSPWQNESLPEDVNGDGLVVPLDALLVINALNGVGPEGVSVGPLPEPTDTAPPPFLDVDGDGQLAPIDALMIINSLNSQDDAANAAKAAKPVADPAVSSVTLRATDMALAVWARSDTE